MRKIFLLIAIIGLTPFITSAQSFEEKMTNQLQTYLLDHVEEYGISVGDIQNSRVSDLYQSSHNGVTHLYLAQEHQGIELRSGILSASIWKGEVMSVSHRFVTDLAGQAPVHSPSISQEEAINAAASYLELTDYSSIVLEARATGPNSYTEYLVPGLSNQTIPVKLAWIQDENGQIQLAWEIRIYTTNYQHWWGIWVDAQSEEILGQEDWVIHCNWGDGPESDHLGHTHNLSKASEELALFAPMQIMATPEYRVFDYPVESPNHGSRTLAVDPSDSVASPFGWHDIDGMSGEEFTITRGNNVWAQDDQNGDNGLGASPDGGSSLIFDYSLPSGVAPSGYLDASTTNLFYWNNLIHDVFYQYGFDEVSGNFQENNYGKGGQQGDFVFADAQDGSGLNNANFSTPPDGNSGRMQMFLWATGGGGTVDLLTVNSPAGIAGPYGSAAAGFGPGVPATPLTADVVLVVDSSNTADACSPVVNFSELAGKIALVDRGNCDFVSKVQRCQDAGAIAVIFVNNQPNGIFSPGGNGAGITIPSIMITQTDGNAIKASLQNGPVNATLSNPGNPNDKDGSFDNGIISHEYGHGISTRLTGGPSISCLSNQEQAGEGWSDFFSLVMTTDISNQGADIRGIGTFAFGQPTDGTGIRTYPYSTNIFASPYTYDDVKTLSIPHGVGSVMCSMLWDMYWAMVDQYGYDSDLYRGTGGNNMAIQLVIDGLKLQPCAPGFVDIRDAILLADEINYGGMNKCLIWEVFARRGLGFSADQGSSGSRSDGIEGYDIHPSCQEILYMEKKTESLSVELGGEVSYQFTIRNQKTTTLNQIVLRDTLPEPLTFVAGSASCPVTLDGNIVIMTIDSIEAGVEFTCEFKAQVPVGAEASSFVYQEDFEGNTSAYLPASLVGSDGWKIDSANARSGQVAWFVPNAEATNDQTLTFPIAPLTSPAVLTFWHDYRTETSYDGGIIEILPTQGGGTWFDLGPYILENGYDASLDNNNPAGAVSAFTGNSGGYIKTKIDLTAFLGQQLFIRFRFLSDDNTTDQGWWIDDIAIGKEVLFLNTACVSALEGDSYCNQQQFETLILESGASTAIQKEIVSLTMSIAPNPADQQVTVSWKSTVSEPVKITLWSMLGHEIYSEDKSRTDDHTVLDVTNLPAGIYIVEVSGPGGSSFQRLVIL